VKKEKHSFNDSFHPKSEFGKGKNDETPPRSSPQGRSFIAPSPWGEGWDGGSHLIFGAMTVFRTTLNI